MKGQKLGSTKIEQPEFEIIADIDSVITKSVGFRMHGRSHRLSPITTEMFLEFSKSMSALWSLQDKKEMEPEELIQAYFKLTSTLCNTLTVEDIRSATQAQIAALFQLVVDHSMGKANLSQEEKKKIIQKKIQASEVLRSNSLN